MTTIRENYSLSSKGSGFICGVEFEIESVKEVPLIVYDNFIVEEDPSLRNNGKEFKTPPKNLTDTLALFELLHDNLVLGPNAFTDRTSTHVHVNVRELSFEQVNQLMLTYALLEPLFFAFVGEERQSNIYCVPLSYTYLPNMYKLGPIYLRDTSNWHKYTAFNILPMAELGTVEFRHLYGTNDYDTFSTWLNTLSELYLFIEKNPGFNVVKQLTLGEVSPIEAAEALAKQIVPTLVAALNKPVKHMMENTAIDVCLSVGGIK